MYFKACTPQWQLLGQTSLIRLRSILVLCWNPAHLLSTAGIPPSSTRLHLKAILFNSLIYHKNCAAVYTSRGQTKARVPSAFGGGLLGSAPPSTPHIAEETDAAPEHAVKAKMSQGLNASVFIWQHFFPSPYPPRRYFISLEHWFTGSLKCVFFPFPRCITVATLSAAAESWCESQAISLL